VIPYPRDLDAVGDREVYLLVFRSGGIVDVKGTYKPKGKPVRTYTGLHVLVEAYARQGMFGRDYLRVDITSPGVSLDDAILREDNLSGSRMTGAKSNRAQFFSCGLRDVDLSMSQMFGARFRSCDLRGVDLRGAFLNKAQFIQCRMDKCNLSGAEMYGTVFDDCVLQDAIVEGTTLADAELLDSDLRGMRYPQGPLPEGLKRTSAGRLA